GSPFAYWINEGVRRVFQAFGPFESEARTVKQGLVTGDDFRLVRSWWEVTEKSLRSRWFGFAKGGRYSPFYSDVPLLVGYGSEDQIAIQVSGRYGRGATHYFLPAITWPLRAHRF